MSKKNKDQNHTAEEQEVLAEEQTPEAEAPQPEVIDEPQLTEAESLKLVVAQQEDKFLRLAAEYDNYRKRTTKEKESIWSAAKGDAAAAFLPVYDNLERALKHETADEAYKKGVEMTMIQLKEVLTKLGISEIPALGEAFDPNLHNAVMHVEDDTVGENTVVDVFQTGFMLGEKPIRCSIVRVAN